MTVVRWYQLGPLDPGDNVKYSANNRPTVIGLSIVLALTTTSFSSAATEDGATVTSAVITTPKTGLEAYSWAPTLTDVELKDLLSLVGFKGNSLKIAWAIAKKESNGRPRALDISNATGDESYGLFQINMIGNLGPERRDKFGIKLNTDLMDPVTNAKAAFYMSAEGTDFGPWGVGPNAYDGTPSEPSVTEWLDKYPN